MKGANALASKNAGSGILVLIAAAMIITGIAQANNQQKTV